MDFSLPQNTLTKEDAMEKCESWVESQQQLQEVRRSKRKRNRDSEEGCDSPDENEMDETASLASMCENNKKISKRFKLKDEILNLKCEWRDCDFTSINLEDFLRHVSLHIPNLEVKMNENGEGETVVILQH